MNPNPGLKGPKGLVSNFILVSFASSQSQASNPQLPFLWFLKLAIFLSFAGWPLFTEYCSSHFPHFLTLYQPSRVAKYPFLGAAFLILVPSPLELGPLSDAFTHPGHKILHYWNLPSKSDFLLDSKTGTVSIWFSLPLHCLTWLPGM